MYKSYEISHITFLPCAVDSKNNLILLARHSFNHVLFKLSLINEYSYIIIRGRICIYEESLKYVSNICEECQNMCKKHNNMNFNKIYIFEINTFTGKISLNKLNGLKSSKYSQSLYINFWKNSKLFVKYVEKKLEFSQNCYFWNYLDFLDLISSRKKNSSHSYLWNIHLQINTYSWKKYPKDWHIFEIIAGIFA